MKICKMNFVDKNKLKIKLLIFLLILISKVNANKLKKLVSGFRTPSIEKAPHQVSIRYLSKHICGGNIITKYHVLTIASCVADHPNVYFVNLKILSGTTDQKNANRQGKIHDVSHITIHEQYNPRNSWVHDLAILRITVPFDFSSIRLPVQMESSAAADPTIVRTSGWGQMVLRSPVKSTRYMQTLNLKICAISELLKYWSDYHISTYYQNCAAMVFPDAAVGKGDGGNGLIDGAGKLVGIVSLNVPQMGYPIIYTKIYPHLLWIMNYVNNY